MTEPEAVSVDTGPTLCDVCGQWPARRYPQGKRCHMCWCRDVAAANPVPLPSDPKMRAEIEALLLGVEPEREAKA